jgi:hypothetical protein
MAARQTATAAAHPELRYNLCMQSLDGACSFMKDRGGCGICRFQDRWTTLEVGACCGNVNTHNVAKGGFSLAFSVRFSLAREQVLLVLGDGGHVECSQVRKTSYDLVHNISEPDMASQLRFFYASVSHTGSSLSRHLWCIQRQSSAVIQAAWALLSLHLCLHSCHSTHYGCVGDHCLDFTVHPLAEKLHYADLSSSNAVL